MPVARTVLVVFPKLALQSALRLVRERPPLSPRFASFSYRQLRPPARSSSHGKTPNSSQTGSNPSRALAALNPPALLPLSGNAIRGLFQASLLGLTRIQEANPDLRALAAPVSGSELLRRLRRTCFPRTLDGPSPSRKAPRRS